MARDNQKSKLYAAERKTIQHMGRKFATVWEMQDYVNRITRSRWWKERYPRVKTIVVHDGRGRRIATGYKDLSGQGIIKMPKWSRCEAIVLHEIAHIITGSQKAFHGPEFARNFYDLILRWMGTEAADAFVLDCKEHRVKVGKRMPRLKSEEAQALA